MTKRGSGTVARVCQVLKALQNWRDVQDLRRTLGISVETAHKWLHQMHAEGVLRMRHRKREMREDGNKPSGPMPREYRVASKWGDLT